MPALEPFTAQLTKRQYYGNSYYGYTSPWYNWGRWVVLGGVILIALLIFSLVSCLNARRRKKRGIQPFYGTGWMAQNHGDVQYYGNGQGYNSQPAPPYTSDANTGYPQGQPQQEYGYSGQPNGIELQQPNNTYYPPNRAAENVYQAPPGPPPGMKERI